MDQGLHKRCKIIWKEILESTLYQLAIEDMEVDNAILIISAWKCVDVKAA